MFKRLFFYLFLLIILGCKSGRSKGLLIKDDFFKHKKLFADIQKQACKISAEDSIKSIMKENELGINKGRFWINFSSDSSLLYDSIQNINLVKKNRVKPLLSFLESRDIDYLSCTDSVFVLGYFDISARSEIYLYYTHKIDSIYDGNPGVLNISELLVSKDEDEWAEKLDASWYLVSVKKNL
ncbi:hypothetical protein FAM09_12965 [Niastella caeni]|uniref:Lipoprotein n=1 Tax=Niastella caeni TaxID=2569763 RepID=A0A4S8HV12_9BACT|nr:hypothetical protein [Niastella caeni]THU39410.1 hypothetical protein FAM09_12965 [Niastella caeni]